MSVRDKQAISTWQVVVYDDCVSFKRVDNGQMQESYPPVSISKASVYAAAIVHGLQPPRDLRHCDKVKSEGETEVEMLKATVERPEQQLERFSGIQVPREQFIVSALRLGR